VPTGRDEQMRRARFVTTRTDQGLPSHHEIAVSATEKSTTGRDASVGQADVKREVHTIAASDVDQSTKFHERLGSQRDGAPMEGLRIVRFTHPGSGTSITFGRGVTTAAAGSAEGGLIVSDIEAAHDELVSRGIDVSDIWPGPPSPVEARPTDRDPERSHTTDSCYSTRNPTEPPTCR
jgi:hypothetical protein